MQNRPGKPLAPAYTRTGPGQVTGDRWQVGPGWAVWARRGSGKKTEHNRALVLLKKKAYNEFTMESPQHTHLLAARTTTGCYVLPQSVPDATNKHTGSSRTHTHEHRGQWREAPGIRGRTGQWREALTSTPTAAQRLCGSARCWLQLVLLASIGSAWPLPSLDFKPGHSHFPCSSHYWP
jgi:hypothetical protein